VPTLIKELPPPVRVLIGDFTDEPMVLAVLGLPPATQD
jgi:KaiB domain